MTNPYKTPNNENEFKKYQEPILNWKLTVFAFCMIYVPLLFFIILQAIYASVRY